MRANGGWRGTRKVRMKTTAVRPARSQVGSAQIGSTKRHRCWLFNSARVPASAPPCWGASNGCFFSAERRTQTRRWRRSVRRVRRRAAKPPAEPSRRDQPTTSSRVSSCIPPNGRAACRRCAAVPFFLVRLIGFGRFPHRWKTPCRRADPAHRSHAPSPPRPCGIEDRPPLCSTPSARQSNPDRPPARKMHVTYLWVNMLIAGKVKKLSYYD